MAKISVETDREAFFKSIENWDGVSPSFTECAAGALYLAAAHSQGEQFLRAVAGDIQCGTTTVARWAKGIQPMPRMQKIIVASLAVHLKACLDEADRLHREAHAAFRRMSLDLQATETDDD